MVQETKISKKGLGEKGVSVPVEVLPDTYAHMLHQLKNKFSNSTVTIQQAPGGKAGPVITDNGNMILDLKTPGLFDSDLVNSALTSMSGIYR